MERKIGLITFTHQCNGVVRWRTVRGGGGPKVGNGVRGIKEKFSEENRHIHPLMGVGGCSLEGVPLGLGS